MTDVQLWKDNRSPSVSDTIRVDGEAFDLTGCSVKFRMRAKSSATLKVDASATIVSVPGGEVRYDWAANDVDTAGTFMAWWSVTLPDTTVQDTDEFPVTIAEHGPERLVQFASAEALASRLGVSFSSDDLGRADALLQMASGMIQEEVGQKIALVTDDVLVRPGSYDQRILLPERPVVEVTSVVAQWLNTVPIDLDSQTWYLNGSELVRTSFPLGVALGFETRGRGWFGEQSTLTITYTHGYETIPSLVTALCLEMVARVWSNPGAGSIQSETYGSESITYRDNLPGMMLTPEEISSVKRVLRRTQGSVTLR